MTDPRDFLHILSPRINRKILFIPIFLVPFYLILYKILIPHSSAFGCFDDCLNIVAGYFLLNHKILYSQIFFNHQMLMAYVSFAVQYIMHPVNIYELILRHRQLVFLFGFLMDFLIIYRFSWSGVGFTIFYELGKYYFFGDRFLAEGFVVYPLVYLLGLLWSKLQNEKLSFLDYLLAGFFSWFVIFMREPFVPLAGIAYVLLLLGRRNSQAKIVSLAIFLLLSMWIISITPMKEYVFEVFTVSSSTVLAEELHTDSLFVRVLKMFFYPLYLYFDGSWNFFRIFVIALDTMFLGLLVYYGKVAKKFLPLATIIFLLGLANFRYVTPGTIFYASFHMLPWFGMFVFILFLLLQKVTLLDIRISQVSIIFLTIILAFLIFSPQSYIREKTDRQYDFITNYGIPLQTGEVVRVLSQPKDTLFSDGENDLIYWQSKRLSPYKYAWYTSVMPLFPIYTTERLTMFAQSPPDFYYDFCTKEKPLHPSLPNSVRALYVQLYATGKPTCLYVKKTKLPQITALQWKKAAQFLYTLPNQTQQP